MQINSPSEVILVCFVWLYRQPHLPNVECTYRTTHGHLKTLFCYRKNFIAHQAAIDPPRDAEVARNASLQTYGSVFFVLCSLYFIVFEVFRPLG